MGKEVVVQEWMKTPLLSQSYPTRNPPPRTPEPHSILESRDLGNWASGWVGVSEIGWQEGEPTGRGWGG